MGESLQGGIVLTLVEAIGDFSFKKAAIEKSSTWLITGFCGYNALAWTLYYYLGFTKLAILNGYWDAISNVMTYSMGWLWFGEKILPRQHLGFILICLGGYFMRD